MATWRREARRTVPSGWNFGQWVVLKELPEDLREAPAEDDTRRLFEACVGRPLRIVGGDFDGDLELDCGPAIDAQTGGLQTSIFVEPHYVRRADRKTPRWRR